MSRRPGNKDYGPFTILHSEDDKEMDGQKGYTRIVCRCGLKTVWYSEGEDWKGDILPAQEFAEYMIEHGLSKSLHAFH
jgi:hypothetical protein